MVMPAILTMDEFFALDPEVIEELLPPHFDPEAYCRQFGQVEYQRYYHMVSIRNSAMVRLRDGSRLKYDESHMEFIPLGNSADN
jgi:hypothetical protein